MNKKRRKLQFKYYSVKFITLKVKIKIILVTV